MVGWMAASGRLPILLILEGETMLPPGLATSPVVDCGGATDGDSS